MMTNPRKGRNQKSAGPQLDYSPGPASRPSPYRARPADDDDDERGTSPTSLDELRRAHAHLAAIVASSQDAIISTTLDATITSWNEAATRMFGYTAREAIGQPSTMLLPADRPDEEREILERVARGERIEHFETVRVAHDGQLVPVALTISPVLDEIGRVIGVGQIARDITADQRAERTQAHLAAIVASSQDAIVSKTLDGIITSWNEAATRIFGYLPEEAIGQPVTMLIPPDRQGEEREILERIARGERIEHFDTVRVARDGHRLHVSLTISPVLDEKGRVIGASKIARDVTERRSVDEMFRIAVESSPNGMVMVGVDGRIALVNAETERMFGYARDELVGQPIDMLVPERFRGAQPPRPYGFMGAIGSGREQYSLRKDGSEFPVEIELNPIDTPRGAFVLGTIVDITERKRFDEQIARLNAQLQDRVNELQALLAVLPVGVFIAQDAACETIFANPAGAAMLRLPTPTMSISKTGLDSEKLPFRVIRDGREVPAPELPMQRSVRNQEQIRAEEYQVVFEDGTVAHLLESVTPLLGEGGQVRGCVAAFVDITERKRSEEQLLEAKTELERRVQERTRELRGLTHELIYTERRERQRLAGVLHDDLQQVLAAIKLQADVVQMYPGRPEPIQRVKKLVDEAVAACRLVTKGLMPPVLRDGNMSTALEWLSRQMAEQYGLRVIVEAEEPAGPLQEDVRVMLFEIARELLFNVVKHADVDEAHVRFGEREGLLLLEVLDRGKGCPPEQLNRSGRDSFGLFSIRERLSGFSGTFEAEGALDEGCRIRVSVPLSSANLRSTRAKSDQKNDEWGDRKRGSKLRVILADDHQTVRQGLAELLQAQGDIDVVAQAADGAEALELAREYRPDVVVMDITMPRMNGIDATRAIRTQLPEIRVIGLSMHEQSDMAAAMRAAGAETFLTKSGPVEDLLAALRGVH